MVAAASRCSEKSRILHQRQCTWAFFQRCPSWLWFPFKLKDFQFSNMPYTLKRSQFLSTTITKCRQRDSAAGIFIHEQYITFKNRSCCTWWNDTVVLSLYFQKTCMWLPFLKHTTAPTCSGSELKGHGLSSTPPRLQYFMLPLFLLFSRLF